MRAIIEIDVPDHQIGQEVSIYFKDTMMIKGIVQEPKTGLGDILIADQCECENCIHEEMCKWKEERHGQECAYMQEPKTGHWIQTNEFFINQDGQFIYKFICSECKSLSYFRKSNNKAIGANVCPNCGCCMVEPQESEDKE